MKEMKRVEGITLIALIITIVVLLILATAAIKTIQNSDIIGKANEVVSLHNEKVNEENTIIGTGENTINKFMPDEMITITFTAYTSQPTGNDAEDEITIIAKYTYEVKKGTTWREFKKAPPGFSIYIDDTEGVTICYGDFIEGNIVHRGLDAEVSDVSICVN